jgi:hypothetical protein
MKMPDREMRMSLLKELKKMMRDDLHGKDDEMMDEDEMMGDDKMMKAEIYSDSPEGIKEGAEKLEEYMEDMPDMMEAMSEKDMEDGDYKEDYKDDDSKYKDKMSKIAKIKAKKKMDKDEYADGGVSELVKKYRKLGEEGRMTEADVMRKIQELSRKGKQLGDFKEASELGLMTEADKKRYKYGGMKYRDGGFKKKYKEGGFPEAQFSEDMSFKFPEYYSKDESPYNSGMKSMENYDRMEEPKKESFPSESEPYADGGLKERYPLYDHKNYEDYQNQKYDNYMEENYGSGSKPYSDDKEYGKSYAKAMDSIDKISDKKKKRYK